MMVQNNNLLVEFFFSVNYAQRYDDELNWRDDAFKITILNRNTILPPGRWKKRWYNCCKKLWIGNIKFILD